MPLVQFDWNNLLKDKPVFSGLGEEYLKNQKDYFSGFAFINHLENLNELEQIEKKIKEWAKYKHLVVFGMGGSALGSRMMFDFLKNLPECSSKSLEIIDSLDPEVLRGKIESIDYSQTVFHVVSKSGNTLETLIQVQLLLKKLKEHSPQNWKEQIVITSDVEGGLLKQFARDENLSLFEIPKNLGGRFSALSSVALLALSFIGINIRHLVEQAKDSFHTFILQKETENEAYRLATLLHHQFQTKKRQVLVLWFYSESLLSLGAWLAQLWAESLGKIDEQGNAYGFTPLVCLGPRDQHSLLQLFEQGPNHSFFIFFDLVHSESDLSLLLDPAFEKSLSYLKDKKLGEVLQIQSQSVKQALKEAGRDLISLQILKRNEESLAYLISLFFMTTVYLSEFARVNPFDQPGVERAKTLSFEKITNTSSQ